MHQEIHAIRFDVEDIGKHVKSSKKRFSWTFGLNARNHTVILDFSFISGKVKLVVDRKTMIQTQLPANSSFQHPFTLDGYAVNILQQGESFELRINNKVFSHLYNQAKTNTEFKNYEDEVKDIKVNENSFQNGGKPIKLNIGALDAGKKKNKQAVETQNWGNFGGADLGIPSYFGQTAATVGGQGQKKQIKKNKSLLDEDEQSSTQSNASQQKRQQTNTTNQVDFFKENESQGPATSISPSQEHLHNLLNKKEDFNTMQNMFSTMQVSPQGQTQPKQQNSLDLLNISTAQPTTSNDFNTMQMMFATNTQGVSMTQPKVAMPTGAQDFNTMQNLFATGMPTQNFPGINVPTNPPAQGQVTVPAATSNINDFYSINGLFATGVQGQVPAQQGVNLQAPVNLGVNNVGAAGNFNTMQNLFATSNPSQISGNVGFSQSTNIQQIPDIKDFNTIQNLFKTTTGAGITLSPPTENPSQSTKQDDPFALLGMPQMTQTAKKVETTSTSTTNSSVSPMMFNTYSGAKSSSTSASLDVSSFGTMQKGSAGNVDFFQNLGLSQPGQSQQEVPNFSKKKQPVAQDLI